MALKSLHAETGEPRFATVQALVRRPDTVADAYVTMVEENEIRLGLSHYERARVAALATARGVFAARRRRCSRSSPPPAAPSARASARSWRSTTRSTAPCASPPICPSGSAWRWSSWSGPGRGPRIAEALARADPRTPEAELAALAAALGRARPPAPRRDPARRDARAVAARPHPDAEAEGQGGDARARRRGPRRPRPPAPALSPAHLLTRSSRGRGARRSPGLTVQSRRFF